MDRERLVQIRKWCRVEYSEKQKRDRMRFLSDKMETIWTNITPQLMEFDELKKEFEQIHTELAEKEIEREQI